MENTNQETSKTEMNKQAAQSELRVLRIKEVAKKLGIGVSTIYDWMDTGSGRFDDSFPRPIRLGQSSVGWLSTEVDAWILKRAEESRI